MKSIIFFIVIFSSFNVLSYTVISDLDDTVKVTNVADTSSAIRNAIFSKKAFEGIPDVLNKLEKNSSGLYILSASPFLLNTRIKSFLNFNKINYRSFYTRSLSQLGRKVEYKLGVIKEVFDKHREDLILIGDNGEADPEIYLNFKANNENTVEKIYIHQVQDKPLVEGVEYFFTAFDIAVSEYHAGRLNALDVQAIANKIILSRDLTKFFPKFAYCPTQKSEFNTHPLSVVTPAERAVRGAIIKFCSKRVTSQIQ